METNEEHQFVPHSPLFDSTNGRQRMTVQTLIESKCSV
jgi:hypothetical protein